MASIPTLQFSCTPLAGYVFIEHPYGHDLQNWRVWAIMELLVPRFHGFRIVQPSVSWKARRHDSSRVLCQVIGPLLLFCTHRRHRQHGPDSTLEMQHPDLGPSGDRIDGRTFLGGNHPRRVRLDGTAGGECREKTGGCVSVANATRESAECQYNESFSRRFQVISSRNMKPGIRFRSALSTRASWHRLRRACSTAEPPGAPSNSTRPSRRGTTASTRARARRSTPPFPTTGRAWAGTADGAR